MIRLGRLGLCALATFLVASVPAQAIDLKQTTDDVLSDSIYCINGGASGVLRTYDVGSVLNTSDPVHIDSVSYGIGTGNPANAPGGARVYALTNGLPLTSANLVQLDAPAQHAGTAGTVAADTTDAVILHPDTTKLVVEAAGTNGFRHGMSLAGETAPTYIRGCGLADPVTLPEIGFPGLHAILFPTVHTQKLLTADTDGSGAGAVTAALQQVTMRRATGASALNCRGSADCETAFDPGTAVNLTATPDQGSHFVGWTGDCAGTQATCSVTMSAARSVTAIFDGEAQTLKVALAGAGQGTVISTPGGIGCPFGDGPYPLHCSAKYGFGSPVLLTAVPSLGSTFGGFQGCNSVPVRKRVAIANTCLVTMDAAHDVTATFLRDPSYIGGSGHMPSAPAGGSTPGGSTPGGNSLVTSDGEVAGNVYSDPAIELLTRTGLVKQLDLRLTCGTLACGGITTATLTLAGEKIGDYDASVLGRRMAVGDSTVVHLATSRAVRRKLSKARDKHPNASPRLKITTVFGMANRKLVTKSLKLRLA